MAWPTEEARVECKVTADGACTPCGEQDQDQSYCRKNGWKQQVRCLETRPGANQSYIEAETTSYYTYEACPVTFDGFAKFEVSSSPCRLLSADVSPERCACARVNTAAHDDLLCALLLLRPAAQAASARHPAVAHRLVLRATQLRVGSKVGGPSWNEGHVCSVLTGVRRQAVECRAVGRCRVGEKSEKIAYYTPVLRRPSVYLRFLRVCVCVPPGPSPSRAAPSVPRAPPREPFRLTCSAGRRVGRHPTGPHPRRSRRQLARQRPCRRLGSVDPPPPAAAGPAAAAPPACSLHSASPQVAVPMAALAGAACCCCFRANRPAAPRAMPRRAGQHRRRRWRRAGRRPVRAAGLALPLSSDRARA